MKEFALIIVSIIIFLVVFEGVLPKGKFGKHVKTVMSLVTVLVILIPVVNIFNSDYDFNSILNNNDNYEKYLEEYKMNTLKKEIKTVLESESIEVGEVFVEMSNEKNIVKVLIKKDELNETVEHIDIKEKAKSLIIERLYLKGWEIIVE